MMSALVYGGPKPRLGVFISGNEKSSKVPSLESCITAMSDLPDAERVGKAINFLANTDEEYGRLCAGVSALDHACKTIKALEYLKTSGTVGERQAIVDSSQAYTDWTNKMENFVADREIMRARRATASLLIELWRSVNAARSKGQII